MTSNPIFRGVATALVTPTTENGVDYEALGRLTDWQIEEGINALVIAGTTGEGSTLTVEEHKEVIRYSVQRVNHRIPVIGGTGSNDTSTAIELTKSACEDGVDACLVVTPYYNKATQNGLIAMYKAIADASTKPIIMYNVPSRTGVNIEPSTYAALAGYPNIAAIKEANGNISKIVEAAGAIGDQLDMYSGNDDQVVPILSMGGSGVISVVSNVAPRRTVEMCDRYFAGDVAGAAEIQCELLPLIRALFCEVNPIPVKAAMAAMGYCKNYLRMPLCPMSEANESAMLQIMRDMGILQ